MSLFKNLSGTVLDYFKIGRGVAGDKKLIVNNADINKPEIKFNDTSKKWQFSNDGVSHTDFPSDLTASTLQNEEAFSTTTSDLEGTTVTHSLTNRPGVATYSLSGYAIAMTRNGVRMVYNATPSTTEHFKYNSSLNRMEVLASGLADDFAVFYLSQGSYQNLESLVPDWTQSDWLDNWHNVQSYVIKKREAGSNPHAVMAYANTTSITGAAYIGAILSGNRVYLVPNFPSGSFYFHYIDCATLAIGTVVGSVTPVNQAYRGGILNTSNRIYLSPYAQANQSSWHYINVNTNTIMEYAHGLGGDTPVANAYFGGALAPDGKIYFAPNAQANQSTWHYISTSGVATAYAHGLGASTPVANAYRSAVLAPNGRIYLIPYAQANQSMWHYIDTTTGTVVAYAHNLGVDTPIANAYQGAVIAANGRIYLSPFAQCTEDKWHYIDTKTDTPTVVAYAHGLGADKPVTGGYAGAVLAPNGLMFLLPSGQADVSKWHTIDTTTTIPVVATYTHGATCLDNGYYGGVLTPTGRIILAPYANAPSGNNWHYIDTKPNSPWNTNMCTNPMFNKY